MIEYMNQTEYKLKSASILKKPAVQQATIQDNKENFAGGFSGLASLYTAEALEEGKARQAIEIVTAAIDKSRVKVSRTHSAGSFGRRTLVNFAFDVDLIVYVKSYDGRDMTDPDIWRYDTDLVTAMRRHVKEALETANSAWDVEIPSDAHYCDVLQVEVLGTHVDLLLVPDCVRGKPVDPVWYQHEALTKEVYGNPAGAEYDQIRERADAAAFTRFVDTVHDAVKSVVRGVKALYKHGVLGDEGGGLKGGGSWWPPEDDRIRSVSLEMLVLAADQQLRQREYGGGQPAHGDVYKLDLFLEVLELVVAAVRDKKVVTVSAGEWGYPGEAQDFAHCWEDDAIRIIHPIDPTCNLERPRGHRGASNCRPLVALAESILKLVHGGGTFQDLCAVPAVRRAMEDLAVIHKVATVRFGVEHNKRNLPIMLEYLTRRV
ncbi:hypothetical protein HXX76_001931 [Chlamydomonas incerta]|uniref:Nucleotidyltransferase n=1 Tax=Chlamydomonas incerta TaxID=51695 RepID=A0A835WA44_CHLIN|nr:hypothetical protein HXX76_001931 [Chlamydomonas incerta]|eukprot:KAG2443580.1 hypothetical protein HXX76_001931 [Chlamydomonas incerta]